MEIILYDQGYIVVSANGLGRIPGPLERAGNYPIELFVLQGEGEFICLLDPQFAQGDVRNALYLFLLVPECFAVSYEGQFQYTLPSINKFFLFPAAYHQVSFLRPDRGSSIPGQRGRPGI